MPKRDNGRNGGPIFPGQLDLNPVTKACNQVSEPDSRLREQVMAPSGHPEKPVEFIHQVLRSAGFAAKPFPFSPLDLALKGILVQPLKKLLCAQS
ncbi:MAG TPA: hypothetical protein VI685_27050 [Candidatus Angelobacter sp.]